jgi:exosome complex exonuclease RRP6
MENSRSMMDTVLQKSKEIALQRYARDAYDITTGSGAFGWDKILSKINITGVQRDVFKAVHAWRDRVAREEDESPHFVMSRSSLLGLATNMPTSVAGVLRYCPATGHIPRKRASELAQLIKEAQDSANDNKGTAVRLSIAAAPGVDTKIPVDVFEVDKLPDIRTQTSSFWGQASGSSKWETVGQGGVVDRGVRLAVPLPELTAAVFVTGDGLASPTPQKAADPGARAEHQYVKDRGNLKKEDEILVIRSLGGGRKRKMGAPAEDSIATGRTVGSHIESPHGEKGSLPVEADAPEQDGEQGPAGTSNDKHKKRKRDHQDQEGQAEGDSLSAIASADQGAVEAFDYSKAPSILHSKKRAEDTGSHGKASSPKKAFDPYSNPEDGPKGMRRGQRERAGKSMTFKS